MKPPQALWRSKASALAVTVTVRPRPTSLLYSSKIMDKLQTFGVLKDFQPIATSALSPRKGLGSTYRVLFESSEAAAKAVAAKSFVVEAYHNLLPANALDPFNVLGLQHRKQPEAQTFECEVTMPGQEQEEHGENAQEQEEHRDSISGQRRVLVTDERSGLLYKGLLDGGAPVGLLDGLSSIIESTPLGRTVSSSQLDFADLHRQIKSKDRMLGDLPTIRHCYPTRTGKSTVVWRSDGNKTIPWRSRDPQN